MKMRNDMKHRENGKLIGGLILVAVGVALLFRNMGFFMPRWLFSWPMILILVGVYTGFKHNFRNNTWVILVAVGSFFLVSKFMPELKLQPYFWPAIIIAAGLAFMLRPGRHIWESDPVHNDPNQWATGVEIPPGNENTVRPDNNDFVRITSVFSGVNRRVLSKNFQGAYVSSVFGGAEIDLTQADITGPVIIKAEVVFGGVKIIVPSHWAVQNEIDGVFHGVEDKRKFYVPAELNKEKLIILKGSVVFGGIEIKSY